MSENIILLVEGEKHSTVTTDDHIVVWSGGGFEFYKEGSAL